MSNVFPFQKPVSVAALSGACHPRNPSSNDCDEIARLLLEVEKLILSLRDILVEQQAEMDAVSIELADMLGVARKAPQS